MKGRIEAVIEGLDGIERQKKAKQSEGWKLVKIAIDNRDINWLKKNKTVIIERLGMDNSTLSVLIMDTDDHEFIIECLVMDIIDLNNEYKKYKQIAEELIILFQDEKELQEFIERLTENEEERVKIYKEVLKKKCFPELIKKCLEYAYETEREDYLIELIQYDFSYVLDYFGISQSDKDSTSTGESKKLNIKELKTRIEQGKIKLGIAAELILSIQDINVRRKLIEDVIDKYVAKASSDTCKLSIATQNSDFMKECVRKINGKRETSGNVYFLDKPKLIAATKDPDYIKSQIELYRQTQGVRTEYEDNITPMICALNPNEIKQYLKQPLVPEYGSEVEIGDIITATNDLDFIGNLENDKLKNYIKKARENKHRLSWDDPDEQIEIKQVIKARKTIIKFLQKIEGKEKKGLQPIIERNLQQLRELYAEKYQGSPYEEVLKQASTEEMRKAIEDLKIKIANVVHENRESNGRMASKTRIMRETLEDMIELLQALDNSYSCSNWFELCNETDYYLKLYEELQCRKKIEEMIGANPELSIGEEIATKVSGTDFVTGAQIITGDMMTMKEKLLN